MQNVNLIRNMQIHLLGWDLFPNTRSKPRAQLQLPSTTNNGFAKKKKKMSSIMSSK